MTGKDLGRVPVRLYLHRDQGDAWLVSGSGVGAGIFVPKSSIEWKDAVRMPTLAPEGPFAAEIDRNMGELKGLVTRPDPNQGDLF